MLSKLSKMHPAIVRIPNYAKVGCNESPVNCMFFEPQTSRFKPQNRQKKHPGNKHEQIHLFGPGYLKNFRNGEPQSSQNRNESNSGTQSLLSGAPGSPMVVPGSAHNMGRCGSGGVKGCAPLCNRLQKFHVFFILRNVFEVPLTKYCK